MAPKDIELLRQKIAQAQASGFRTPRNNVLENLTNSIETVKKTVKKGHGLKLDDVRKVCAENMKLGSEKLSACQATMSSGCCGEIAGTLKGKCAPTLDCIYLNLDDLERWKTGSKKMVAGLIALVFLLVCASFLVDPSQIADQWSPAAAPEEETAVAAPPYGEIDPTTGELVPYGNNRRDSSNVFGLPKTRSFAAFTSPSAHDPGLTSLPTSTRATGIAAPSLPAPTPMAIPVPEAIPIPEEEDPSPDATPKSLGDRISRRKTNPRERRANARAEELKEKAAGDAQKRAGKAEEDGRRAEEKRRRE
eukprot:CAMPEP_0198199894 /NCGR_PEP_ID=MMETSP1445-20131203/3011_1 /TAXON_ID=36898 /ORGANISM="Pyramimonas sp., Strain CCMP2087" /LENGTH=305 /DNA_ID=CAMNT_0043869799 /DNA_START=301 /DNA_END=1215 /DNA_ORIENTATION=-